MDNYGNEYGELRLYPEESTVVTVLKGLLGAIIGAIPGTALWIIIGKAGYVASFIGLVLAVGVIAGYGFMTKKSDPPALASIVICGAVMLIALYMSQKIIWTWELADTFKEILPQWKDMIIAEAQALGATVTEADLIEILGPNYMEDALMETFGFTEGTFSDCFSNFWDLMEKLELKSDFFISFGKSCLFAFIGGAASFAKLK